MMAAPSLPLLAVSAQAPAALIAHPGAAADGPTAAAARRLRWRARRGLLENDLLLGRFFARHGAELDATAAAALGALLDLPDGQLLDLVLGRVELTGSLDAAPVHAVLGLLRAS